MGASCKAVRSTILGGCAVIFVTVGTQLPFDRLISAVDAWAQINPAERVFAQVGPGKYKPAACEFADFVPPDRANLLFQESSLIVSHAGMGSILTALRYRKPILIMPRKASLGEHRNEHQLATARWLGGKPGIFVADSVEDISSILSRRSSLKSSDGISQFAGTEFTDRLRQFIDLPR